MNRTFSLFLAMLLAGASAAQAQSLTLTFDTAAETYRWSGSLNFNFTTSTPEDSDYGGKLAFGFSGVSDGSVPFPGPGLNQSATVQSTSSGNIVPGEMPWDEVRTYQPTAFSVAVTGDNIPRSYASLSVSEKPYIATLDESPLSILLFPRDGSPANLGSAGTIQVITPVPEPATIGVVAGLGLVGLAGWRRRQQAVKSVA